MKNRLFKQIFESLIFKFYENSVSVTTVLPSGQTDGL